MQRRPEQSSKANDTCESQATTSDGEGSVKVKEWVSQTWLEANVPAGHGSQPTWPAKRCKGHRKRDHKTQKAS